MDGDRVGDLLSKVGAATVARALEAFSAEVPNVAAATDAVLVYAGGDDILCLAPLDTALEAAQKFQEAYAHAWEAAAPGVAATMSAAPAHPVGRCPMPSCRARLRLWPRHPTGHGRPPTPR